MRVKIIVIFFILFISILLSSFCLAQPSQIAIKGERGSWYLEVNGKEFYIKGAGCGLAKGKNSEDYLNLAKELGANTVRTWGIDQGTEEYLDTAYKYGLYVCAGIWINFTDERGFPSYIYDEEYKEMKRKEVLDYINKFKDHPAILFWNLGNEAIYWTKDTKEKIAIAKFLESLIQEIHKIDPNHPVIYACTADYEELKIIKEFVRSLDLLGINSYGSIRFSYGKWDYLGFNIPFVITEFGPCGPWNRPKDVNGISLEQSDTEKAKLYKHYLEQIFEFKGYNLGAFVFHLGETTQESLTWWNINEGNLKRESFWVIHNLYTGKNFLPSLPKIKKFFLSKYKDLRPNEFIDAFVEVDGEDLEYSYKLSTALEGILQYYVNEPIETEVLGEGKRVKIKVPDKKGIYRIYCFVRDKEDNVTSSNCSISVTER